MSKPYWITIPTGTSGQWSVERFVVSEEESYIGRMRAMCNPSAMGRFVPPGAYTALKHEGSTVMSTTPDEMDDIRLSVCGVRGDGLVAGLGLGCAVMYALSRKGVGRVTVIEKSVDVIRLVAPTLKKTFRKRLEIVEGDIFMWKPPGGRLWDWGWYDIWDNICDDNRPEMTRLKLKFKHRVSRQMCWGEELLLGSRRRSPGR